MLVFKLNLCSVSRTLKAAKGYLQGGVQSRLLWTIVIDELLKLLNNFGFRTHSYVDDLVISVTGFDDVTLSERKQQALFESSNWCNSTNTVLIPFTRLKSRLKTAQPMGFQMK